MFQTEKYRHTTIMEKTKTIYFFCFCLIANSAFLLNGFATGTDLGFMSSANGYYAVSMGVGTSASGTFSLATGASTSASASQSLSAGSGSTASGISSFAAGQNTHSDGRASAAFGEYTTAWGENSLALGGYTSAEGNASIAAGWGSTAYHDDSLVAGLFNDPLLQISDKDSPDRPLFLIGNGTSDSNRSNAFEVYANGDVYIERVQPRGGISMGSFQ